MGVAGFKGGSAGSSGTTTPTTKSTTSSKPLPKTTTTSYTQAAGRTSKYAEKPMTARAIEEEQKRTEQAKAEAEVPESTPPPVVTEPVADTTISKKPGITAAVEEPTKITVSDGTVLVKAPGKSWETEAGVRPTEKQVIQASSILRTQQKKKRADWQAKYPQASSTVPLQQMMKELFQQYKNVNAQADKLRELRKSLTSPADNAKKQELLSKEAALRQESQIISKMMGERKTLSPTPYKGTVTWKKYQDNMNVLRAREILRPFYYKKPKSDKLKLDIVAAFETGLGSYDKSKDTKVDEARRIASIMNLLKIAGVPDKAIVQGKKQYYELKHYKEQQLAVEEFKKGHVETKDGYYINIDDWNKLPKRYKEIAMEQGWEVVIKTNKDEVALLNKLEKFKVSRYSSTGYHQDYDLPGYDLSAALRKGMDPEKLKQLFPKEAVDKAIAFNKETERLARVEQLYQTDVYQHEVTGKIISEAEYRRMHRELNPEVDHYAKQLPGLILALDPKWQELKNKPDTDPEKIAYKQKWQDKLVDTIMFTAMAFTPYTMGGISALGRIAQVAPRGISTARAAISAYNGIVKMGTSIAKLSALYPTIHTVGNIADEVNASRLQNSWQVFDKLPLSEKDNWADKAGYEADYSNLTDNQKAVVLLHYSKPPEVSTDSWQRQITEKQELLQSFALEKSQWLQEKAPAPISKPVVFAGGTVVGVLEGLGYTASIPLIAGMLTKGAVTGAAPVAAKDVVKGMAIFFTTTLPKAFAADPTLTAGRITGLFLLSPAALSKMGSSFKARFRARYVPERAMSIEAGSSAIQVPFTVKNLPELMKIPQVKRMRLVEKAIQELIHGAKEAKIEGTTATITIKNVPYQRIVGNSLFHYTTNIKAFEGGKVPVKTRLFTSPQAAIRFAIMSSKGQVGKNSGLIEVRVPEGYRPRMVKILKRGNAEVESIFGKDTILQPIQSSTGKGISANVKVGAYPIRRFTVLNLGKYPIKELTPTVLAKLRIAAAKEAVADTFLGWHTRMQILKEPFQKNIHIIRLQKYIKQLKAEKPEVTDNVKLQRKPIPHPEGQGELKTRVRVITLNETGNGVYVGLDRSAPSFEFFGGSADASQILTQSGKWKNFNKAGENLTWAEAGRSQVLGETMLKMPKMEYLGIYLGKVNDNALSGARVYLGKGIGKANNITAWNKYQRYKFGYKTPELKAIALIKKTGEIVDISPGAGKLLKSKGLNPASYDIAGVLRKKGWNLDTIKVDKSNKWLLKARDKSFADRIINKKNLTPEQIANINNAEIKLLKARLYNLAKGKQPQLADWITSEADLSRLAEILHGRRQAVKISLKSKISDSDVKVLTKLLTDNKVNTKKINHLTQLLKRLHKDEAGNIQLTREARTEIEKVINETFSQVGRANKVLREYGYNAYRAMFEQRYSMWLSRLASATIGQSDDYKIESLGKLGKRYILSVAKERPNLITATDVKYVPNIIAQTQYKIDQPEYKTYKIPTSKSDYPTTFKEKEDKIPVIPKSETKPIPHPHPMPREIIPRDKPYPEPRKEIIPEGNKLLIPDIKTRTTKKPQYATGKIAWKQGRLKKKGGGTADHWIVITPPYKGQGGPTVEHIVSDIPPAGVRVAPNAKTAYASIQATGEAATASEFTVDMGFMDVKVNQPEQIPGKLGAISFKTDPEQKTVSDITIGESPKSPKGIRGTSTKAIGKLPLSTTLGQLLTIEYKSDALKSFAKKKSLPAKIQQAGARKVAEELYNLRKQGKLKTKAQMAIEKRISGKKEKRRLGDSYEDTIGVIKSMMPDSEARVFEATLADLERVKLAPVRSYPKPTMLSHGRIARVKARQKTKKSKIRGWSSPSIVSTWVGV